MFALWSSSSRRLIIVSLAILFWSGCSQSSGPRRVPVRGTVKLAGQLFQPTSISFQPTEGHSGPAANTAIVNGVYQFTTEDGPTAGPHRVLISVAPAKGSGGENDPPRPKKTRWEFSVTVPEAGLTKDFQVEDK
ncbi:MAG: hypothetical protein HZA46_12735 [Planctomycetales bacterium]|nr:hypothetical protein [Planctomycetales bacterium]